MLAKSTTDPEPIGAKEPGSPSPPTDRAQLKGMLALAAAASIWGSSGVAAKVLLDDIPPLTLATLRWLLAASALTLFALRNGERPVFNRTTLWLGLSGITVFYIFFNWGLKFTTVSNANLIHGTMPVLTALISAAVLKEHLNRRGWLGIAFSLVGVATVVGIGNLGNFGIATAGDILVFGSAISWAAYTVLSRRSMIAASPAAITSGAGIIGLATILPISFGELVFTDIGHLAVSDYGLLLYLGLVASAGAFALWGIGLTTVEASKGAVFANLVPFVGVASAAVLLDERITMLQITGGAIILAGVVLTSSSRRIPKKA